MVINSNSEKRLIQDYVKHLRKEYLLKNIHLPCDEKFIPSNFISSHFDKLSQMVGERNSNEISKRSIDDYYYDYYDYYYYDSTNSSTTTKISTSSTTSTSSATTPTTSTTTPPSTTTKDDINFGAEMFMALNSCPTFYVKLYWKAIYRNESRIAQFASNIIWKAEDSFKGRAQKIFAKISAVIGFQHITYRNEGNRSIAMNNELSKNMLDIKGIVNPKSKVQSPKSQSQDQKDMG